MGATTIPSLAQATAMALATRGGLAFVLFLAILLPAVAVTNWRNPISVPKSRRQSCKKAGDWKKLLVEEITHHPQEDLPIMLADQLRVGNAFEEWLSEPRTVNTTKRQRVIHSIYLKVTVSTFNIFRLRSY